MSVMRVILLHPCTKFEFRRPSRSEDMADIFYHGVKRPGDLDLWPFELWMGSRITHITGFHRANFQLPMPFRSRRRVRHGTDTRTDRQWTGHQCIMRQLWGRGHNNIRQVKPAV